MFDLGSAEACVCIRRGEPSAICDGNLRLQEKGKKAMLTPKKNEKAKLLALDGCYIKNNQPKCDAIFFLETENKAFMIFTELKGGDIDPAFEQINYTRSKQPRYAELLEAFQYATRKTVREEAFIISNHQINKAETQRFERRHGVRVKSIIHCEASSRTPELRDRLN
jgi:hypothetical protein